AAYSDFRVVQEGERTSCPKNNYAKKRSTSIGGIVGGVVAALAVVLIGGLLFFLARRRSRRLRAIPSHHLHRHGSKATLASEDMALSNGPAGVVRAGTFNLGNVAFTEPSLDHLRQIDHPPLYEGPPNVSGGTTTTAALPANRNRDEIVEVAPDSTRRTRTNNDRRS
ncbi:hypothetical protein JCM10212_003587, partial [Sporobolomyces blumeae]